MPDPDESFNQAPPLSDINLYTSDPVLQEAVSREGAGWHAIVLAQQGDRLGQAATLHLADLANRHPPQLISEDALGQPVDRVDFDPAWTRLMEMLHADGVHSSAWLDPQPGAHVARAASFFLHGQAEAGSLCPVTMTFAALPVLRREPALFSTLTGHFASRDYDPRDIPLGAKRSVTIGMGMTEKQGGSDLRTNTTRANALATPGRGHEYALEGRKWFFSAPTADAHLVLARDDDGLSCFFVPRWRVDGTRNAVHIERLKDKLGNRSNASAEVEFRHAAGTLVGEPGRGIPTLIEMAAQTRLDCVLGSAALMRRALIEAIHHARHRSAFGRPLIEQDLMRNVLADLALESEAATMLALHLAAAVDLDTGSAADTETAAVARAWRRIVTPAAKFWICKRAIAFTAECMEVWGGNGYVEDGPMARLLREAPVNSIWEGSGNVMCLDVLRAFSRESDSTALLIHKLAAVCATEPALTHAMAAMITLVRAPADVDWHARQVAMQLVLLAQASLLIRHAPTEVADTFIASRFAHPSGQVAGLLASPSLAQTLLNRAWPA
ncbi:MAG: isovaleryl-CoA dehydrogenase [Azoarcus sp.]|nr:isovaleryl-CoA dehydrogenase [Azoarcus sp.]